MAHSGKIVAQNGKLSVIDCKECGYAHLLEIPTEEQLSNYYVDDVFYTTHSPPDWFEKEEREYRDGLWDAYYGHQLGLIDSKDPFVDIGCGIGTFMDYARNNNRYAYGVEPSKTAQKYLTRRGLVFADTIDALKRMPSFVAKKCNTRAVLVLEHVRDPRAFLREVGTLMAPGNKLLLVVPNEFNPLQRLVRWLRNGDSWFVQPPHINYFTPISLLDLVNSSGFTTTYMGGTYPMELYYLRGRHYIGNDKLGRECHNDRLRFERDWRYDAFKWYHFLFMAFGIGREIILVAEKK